jgi:tetratricopeptide (TPR) repeat protein
MMLVGALAALVLAAGPAPSPSARDSAETRLTLGRALVEKDPAGAERIARDGLNAFPAAPGFHLILGRSMEVRHRPMEAWCEYEWELVRAGAESPAGIAAAEAVVRLLQDNPGDNDLNRAMKGQALLATDPPQAVKVFQELSGRGSHPFVLQLYLAEAQASAGQTDAAIAIYRQLISNGDSSFVPGYVELADLLRARGAVEEANTLLAKAKAIDPANWSLNPR